MKYLFILSFLLIYIFFGLELGYTSTFPLWKHATYMFQHGSIWHLFINSFSFFLMFRILQRYINSWYIISIAFTAAFFMSFICSYSKVVVGSSGMIYTMLGMYFFLVSIHKIRFKNKMSLVVTVTSVTTFLTISFFKPGSAGMLHLLCLLYGYIIFSIFWSLNNKM